MARKAKQVVKRLSQRPVAKLPRDFGELMREVDLDFRKAISEPGVSVDMSAWYLESLSAGECVICLAGACMRRLCRPYSEFFEGRWSNPNPRELAEMRAIHEADADMLLAVNSLREGHISRALLYGIGEGHYMSLGSGSSVFALAAAWTGQLSALGVITQRRKTLDLQVSIETPDYWEDDLPENKALFLRYLGALAPAWDAIDAELKEEYKARMPICVD